MDVNCYVEKKVPSKPIRSSNEGQWIKDTHRGYHMRVGVEIYDNYHVIAIIRRI